MTTTITTTEELDALPSGAVVLDRKGDAWQESEGWYHTLRDAAAEPVGLIEEWGPLTLLHPQPEPAQEPTVVTDLSTLRPGDVIEIRLGDITTRGTVGKVHIVSDGKITRVDRITTPDGQTLWSGLFLSLQRFELYLVSTAKPPLPTHTGAVLTRAVIRGEEVEGPIALDHDGDWRASRKVKGFWYHRPESITDWTIGRVVEADAETDQ
ncbi:hypothetical protein [Salana multivorans]